MLFLFLQLPNESGELILFGLTRSSSIQLIEIKEGVRPMPDLEALTEILHCKKKIYFYIICFKNCLNFTGRNSERHLTLLLMLNHEPSGGCTIIFFLIIAYFVLSTHV